MKCPNGDTVDPMIFKISSKTLARAPRFRAFFKSAYYAWGSNTLITFLNDPAAVWDIIQRYLERGPDLFDMIALRVYIHKRYTPLESTVVVVRLGRMAHNMGLWYLHDMSYEILIDGNRIVTTSLHSILAPLVFGTRSFFPQQTKDWCLVQIGQFCNDLKTSSDWTKCLPKCSDELRKVWQNMLVDNHRIRSALDNSSNDSVIEGMVKRMPYQDQDRAISVISSYPPRTPIPPPTPAASTRARCSQPPETFRLPSRRYGDGDGEDDGWEDVGTTPSSGTPATTAGANNKKDSSSEQQYTSPSTLVNSSPETGGSLINSRTTSTTLGDPDSPPAVSGIGANGQRPSLPRSDSAGVAKAKSILGLGSLTLNDSIYVDPKTLLLASGGKKGLKKKGSHSSLVVGGAGGRKTGEIRFLRSASKRRTRIMSMLHSPTSVKRVDDGGV